MTNSEEHIRQRRLDRLDEITVAEACQILEVSNNTLYKLAEAYPLKCEHRPSKFSRTACEGYTAGLLDPFDAPCRVEIVTQLLERLRPQELLEVLTKSFKLLPYGDASDALDRMESDFRTFLKESR